MFHFVGFIAIHSLILHRFQQHSVSSPSAPLEEPGFANPVRLWLFSDFRTILFCAYHTNNYYDKKYKK